MNDKNVIEKLQKNLDITETENKIITNEENILRKMIERSNQWLDKIEVLNQSKLNLEKL